MIAISSLAFDRNAGDAMKAAERGPVVITASGRPAYVLMTYADYETFRGPEVSVADALAMPEGGDFDTEFPRDRWEVRDIELD